MVTASVTSQMKLQTHLLVAVVSMTSGVHTLDFPEKLLYTMHYLHTGHQSTLHIIFHNFPQKMQKIEKKSLIHKAYIRQLLVPSNQF